MQIAVIEFARNVAGLAGANSTEFDERTAHPVIDFMPEQRVGHRQGRHHAPGRLSLRARAGHQGGGRPTARTEISERHRHRYEVNNNYRELLTAHGLVVSGTSPDRRLVEMIELPDHPYFVGCQFHPEFKSRPQTPAPAVPVVHRRRPAGPRGGAGVDRPRRLRPRPACRPAPERRHLRRPVQRLARTYGRPVARAKASVAGRSPATLSCHDSVPKQYMYHMPRSTFTGARGGPIRVRGVEAATVTHQVR